MRKSTRRGFTLIELLIVIGIVALLIALMLPAVQRIRGAATRTACSNNLRQLVLASQLYHDTHKGLPAGVRWQDGKDPHAYMSWLAQLLPYLQQQALWDQAEAAYRQTYTPQYPYFPATGPHESLFATPVAVFACPSDGRVSQTQEFVIGGTLKVPVALTSYLGCNGTNYRDRDGVLFQDSKVRLTDIRDGTSNTLFAGERPPSSDFLWGWWYAAPGQGFTGSCQFVIGTAELRYSDTPVPCPMGPYRYSPGSLQNYCDIYHYWSPHERGGNFAFADGTVRFLTYSASAMMPALGTRAGGEVVGASW